MSLLTPMQSSNLAADIYLIQNQADERKFFNLYGGILDATPANLMKAEVDSRLLNTRDAFGVACKGTGDYKDDVFLIFRGSTLANYGADWVSNARIGLEIGVSGKPVHIGFNHIFKSMIEQLETFATIQHK